MTDRTRCLITWLAPLFSGGLLASLHEPIAWNGLIWIALLPLIFAIWFQPVEGRSWFKRLLGHFGRGYLAGLVFFGISLSWLSEVVAAEASWFMHLVPTASIALFLALYPAVWALLLGALANPLRSPKSQDLKQADEAKESSLERKVRERMEQEKSSKRASGGRFAWGAAFRSLRCAAIAAGAWVVLEWLRGYLLTGFGWNSLGSTFHNNLYLAQAADLVGEVGLAFVPVFMNVVLADTARRLFLEAREGKFRAHPDFAVGVALIAALFFYGAGRLEQVRSWPVSEVRVLGVQVNLPIDTQAAGLSIDAIYQTYYDATKEALSSIADEQEQAIRAGQDVDLWAPDWIVFPESALPYPLARDHQGDFSEMRQYNIAYYQQGIQPLEEILGPFTWMTGVNERILSPSLEDSLADYNSMWVVEDRIEDSQNWGKKHLVPFGEYIPLQEELPFLEHLFKEATGGNPFGGSFHRGTNQEAMKVKVGDAEVGVIGAICYEDSVPRVLRPMIAQGQPQVIVNITNDAWFNQSAAPLQHFATAKFRAIEFRRPLLRVANTGVTAAVGFDGSLESRRHPEEGVRWIMDPETGPFTSGSLRASLDVPSNGPMSLYAIAGDWFVLFCAGLVLVLGLLAGWMRR